MAARLLSQVGPRHAAAGWVYALTLGFGLVYLGVAVALGLVFCGLAWQLRREITPGRAALLFHYSLAYLALVFVAAAVDPIL